jgi:hypothetical protein
MRQTNGFDIFVSGCIVAAFAFLLLSLIVDLGPKPSLDNTDGCVIITEYGTVLHDPVPGEDDGLVYCPTGELSNSQLGKVVK